MSLEGLHGLIFLQAIQSCTVCAMVERGGRYLIMWMAFFLAMAGDSGGGVEYVGGSLRQAAVIPFMLCQTEGDGSARLSNIGDAEQVSS